MIDVLGPDDIEPEVVFPDEGIDTLEPEPERALGDVNAVSDSYLLPLLVIGGLVAAGSGASVVIGRMRSKPIE